MPSKEFATGRIEHQREEKARHFQGELRLHFARLSEESGRFRTHARQAGPGWLHASAGCGWSR